MGGKKRNGVEIEARRKVTQVDVLDYKIGIKRPKYALMKVKINVLSKL